MNATVEALAGGADTVAGYWDFFLAINLFPSLHFLLPFHLTLYGIGRKTPFYRFMVVFFAVVGYEIYEEVLFWVVHDVAGATDVHQEPRQDSLIGDPLMGFLGFFFALLFKWAFSLPDLMPAPLHVHRWQFWKHVLQYELQQFPSAVMAIGFRNFEMFHVWNCAHHCRFHPGPIAIGALWAPFYLLIYWWNVHDVIDRQVTWRESALPLARLYLLLYLVDLYFLFGVMFSWLPPYFMMFTLISVASVVLVALRRWLWPGCARWLFSGVPEPTYTPRVIPHTPPSAQWRRRKRAE